MADMRIIAIIPARAGSKRLKNKNKKILAGKPLFEWSFQAADKVARINKIIVSSDDEEILELSEKLAEGVAYKRAVQGAKDDSDMVDALTEVIESFRDIGECYDAIVLLQPTSPFRRKETIERALDEFENANGESVVTVSKAKDTPAWYRLRHEGRLEDISVNKSYEPDELYKLNGLVYISSVENILKTGSLYTKNTKAVVVDDELESIDIDTPLDWMIAEALTEKVAD